MVDLVKCFSKIKIDGVHIHTRFQYTKDFIMMSKQLTETRSTNCKAMLTFVEQVVFFQEFHEFVAHHLFKDFDDM